MEMDDPFRPTHWSGTGQPSGSGVATVELFEKAVRLHSRRLLAIARAIVGNRASPEDVVQQAVTNLFQHRHRYDWREPGGLLKRAVVNEALRLLRPPRMSMVADDHPDRTFTPMDGMIENETVTKVRSAIARLPDHFRAALVLCEYENLSYQEIAESLGASVPQVKTWLHRARRQLAEMLKGYVQPRDERGAKRPHDTRDVQEPQEPSENLEPSQTDKAIRQETE
jgi:RNA polymerase sigma-70 factor (ECF subfamily)